MPVEASGDVLMDYLPAPVLGTFWPYSADKDVKLTAVVAGQRKVLVERTSLTLRELLEGNVGADVIVNETPLSGAATKPEGLTYPATIVGLPARSSKELEENCSAGRGRETSAEGQHHPAQDGRRRQGRRHRSHSAGHLPRRVQGGGRQRRVPQPASAQARLGQSQVRQRGRRGPRLSAKRDSLDPGLQVRRRRQGERFGPTRGHADQRVGRPGQRDGQPGRRRADIRLCRHGRPDRDGPGGGPALSLFQCRRADAIRAFQCDHEPGGRPHGRAQSPRRSRSAATLDRRSAARRRAKTCLSIRSGTSR